MTYKDVEIAVFDMPFGVSRLQNELMTFFSIEMAHHELAEKRRKVRKKKEKKKKSGKNLIHQQSRVRSSSTFSFFLQVSNKESATFKVNSHLSSQKQQQRHSSSPFPFLLLILQNLKCFAFVMKNSNPFLPFFFSRGRPK